MRENNLKYFQDLKDRFDEVTVTGENRKFYQLSNAIDKTVDMIIEQSSLGRKLLFIGNGASAAISSHIATDFWKNAGVKALSFNDSSLLTCVSNDFGYKHVFGKPVEMFADSGDILCAISSSGQSENILRAVKIARKRNIGIVTFSGFSRSNSLRRSGDINFYVPSTRYGYVEIIHLSLCHCLVDAVITKKMIKKEKK